MSSSNDYRKARALAAKTVAAGCTAHEHVAATNLAVSIIAKNGLDPSRVDWRTPPPGFAWSGEPGRSELIERPIAPKAKSTRKAKPSTDSTKAKRQTVGERLLTMLQRRNGATLDEITEAFGIQPHTARAVVSVEIRKKRGLDVRLNRETGRYSVAGSRNDRHGVGGPADLTSTAEALPSTSIIGSFRPSRPANPERRTQPGAVAAEWGRLTTVASGSLGVNSCRPPASFLTSSF